MALPWNFHPYGSRTKFKHPSRSSPFKDLNGFQYHDNWLRNLLIASSMNELEKSTHLKFLLPQLWLGKTAMALEYLKTQVAVKNQDKWSKLIGYLEKHY